MILYFNQFDGVGIWMGNFTRTNAHHVMELGIAARAGPVLPIRRESKVHGNSTASINQRGPHMEFAMLCCATNADGSLAQRRNGPVAAARKKLLKFLTPHKLTENLLVPVGAVRDGEH
ncbi:unnamed protein product [Phytophthora lilii]|uniref:Unnamed protein product n=1 Tax=Phytophthora lilii TaxID=2077276 RepID=A0A9W6WUW7_9STRA|nr:unnamed protein product [Phytophthora lilii]